MDNLEGIGPVLEDGEVEVGVDREREGEAMVETVPREQGSVQ